MSPGRQLLFGGLLAGALGLVAAQTVTLDPSIHYTVTLSKGKVAGCAPLSNMLSNQGCDSTVQDLWYQDDGTKNQRYRFVPVPQTNNTFNIISGCQQYLSCQACGGDTITDLYGVDDGSGRQRWILTPVPGAPNNTYTIQVAGGRDASCGTYLSTGAQCGDTYVDLYTSDDGSGRQEWTLAPVPGAGGSLPLAPFKYTELPLGAVKPSPNSWLHNQLLAQADGLHGNLQNFYPTVQTSAWLGGADYSSLHEGGSYWLNGVVPAAFQLGDARLLADIAHWVEYIVAGQSADGWIGPESTPRVLWGTYPAVLALRQYAQANATAAPTILGVLDRYFVLVESMVTESGTGLEEWGIHRWQDLSIVGDPAVLALRQYAQANASAAPTILGVLDRYFVLVERMVTESGTGLEEWGIHRWQDLSIVAEWMLEVHRSWYMS